MQSAPAGALAEPSSCSWPSSPSLPRPSERQQPTSSHLNPSQRVSLPSFQMDRMVSGTSSAAAQSSAAMATSSGQLSGSRPRGSGVSTPLPSSSGRPGQPRSRMGQQQMLMSRWLAAAKPPPAAACAAAAVPAGSDAGGDERVASGSQPLHGFGTLPGGFGAMLLESGRSAGGAECSDACGSVGPRPPVSRLASAGTPCAPERISPDAAAGPEELCSSACKAPAPARSNGAEDGGDCAAGSANAGAAAGCRLEFADSGGGGGAAGSGGPVGGSALDGGAESVLLPPREANFGRPQVAGGDLKDGSCLGPGGVVPKAQRTILMTDQSVTVKAVCGVRMMWVSVEARRMGIVSQLLDIARLVLLRINTSLCWVADDPLK